MNPRRAGSWTLVSPTFGPSVNRNEEDRRLRRSTCDAACRIASAAKYSGISAARPRTMSRTTNRADQEVVGELLAGDDHPAGVRHGPLAARRDRRRRAAGARGRPGAGATARRRHAACSAVIGRPSRGRARPARRRAGRCPRATARPARTEVRSSPVDAAAARIARADPGLVAGAAGRRRPTARSPRRARSTVDDAGDRRRGPRGPAPSPAASVGLELGLDVGRVLAEPLRRARPSCPARSAGRPRRCRSGRRPTGPG